MLKACYKKYTLHFKQPSGTSRGVLTNKDSWFIFVWDDSSPNTIGIGECGLLKGLSIDDRLDYELKLKEICGDINYYKNDLGNNLIEFPSIRFGLEMAFADLHSKENKILFESAFTQGKDSIEVNGLVWMGEFDFMKQQIREKIESGFTCIKLKIGAISFEKELDLIKSIRDEFSKGDIEIRVDANGAFSPVDALDKLDQLSKHNLHSIEQPIRQDQWEEMAELCDRTPLPIALDEELIGVNMLGKKQALIKKIKPQYIVLKPSLLGGFQELEEWIEVAEQNGIGWWITSALESNIGLNAIAQWTYTLKNKIPHGLGTGQLYSNNFISPLEITKGKLYFDPSKEWDLNNLVK